MKNTIYFLFIFFFSLGVSQENEWRWQQEVDYTMVIDVDVENHTYKELKTWSILIILQTTWIEFFIIYILMLLSLARIWNKTQDTPLTIQELCQKTF